MTTDLVQTANGTFITHEAAKAAGLDVKATRKAPAKRKAAPAKRKAAPKKAATTRKGKA